MEGEWDWSDHSGELDDLPPHNATRSDSLFPVDDGAHDPFGFLDAPKNTTAVDLVDAVNNRSQLDPARTPEEVLGVRLDPHGNDTLEAVRGFLVSLNGDVEVSSLECTIFSGPSFDKAQWPQNVTEKTLYLCGSVDPDMARDALNGAAMKKKRASAYGHDRSTLVALGFNDKKVWLQRCQSAPTKRKKHGSLLKIKSLGPNGSVRLVKLCPEQHDNGGRLLSSRSVVKSRPRSDNELDVVEVSKREKVMESAAQPVLPPIRSRLWKNIRIKGPGFEWAFVLLVPSVDKTFPLATSFAGGRDSERQVETLRRKEEHAGFWVCKTKGEATSLLQRLDCNQLICRAQDSNSLFDAWMRVWERYSHLPFFEDIQSVVDFKHHMLASSKVSQLRYNGPILLKEPRYVEVL